VVTGVSNREERARIREELKKRGARSPLKAWQRIAIQIAVFTVLGLIPTCGSMGIVPVGTRIAAPLVCPSGTERSEVVSRWGGSSRGGSSLKWELYCLSPEGYGTIPSAPKTFFVLLGIWTGLWLALWYLLRGVSWLRSRDKEGSANVA